MTEETTARVGANSASPNPKKASKSVMSKRTNPLQKKMKELAHKKMSRDVELAALRNSLPRINVLKHAKLNKEL
jgi:hypothetical protein